MFKAFYWMFQDKQTKINFIKNCINLFIVFIVFICLYLFIMHLLFSKSEYALFLALLLPLCIIPELLATGYFWETVSNTIDRRTEIVSSNVYGGCVKLEEHVELPTINFFSFIWRGFAGSVAILIMEIPVIMLLFFGFLYRYEQLIPAAGVAQVIIWLLSPGLLWNYAKENSIFSILNLYVAGHLFENKPGRYLWNAVLLIFVWGIYTASAYILRHIIGFPSNIETLNEHIKIILAAIILYIPYLYCLHVSAFLIGTLGDSNDF